MNSVDPWAFMQDLPGRIFGVAGCRDIERALDDLEYLKEVPDPELQDPAYARVERLRAKRERAGG